VEMAIHTRGDHTLSGTAEDNSWPLAIRQATLKIEQQAKRLKGKWTARRRQAAKTVRNRKVTPQAGETLPPAEGLKVIRASRYPVKPMSVEDAALRMDDADDDFLVFRNADDDAVSILYRRKDGNLGLIQP
jgi:putative sigma-54 modulation protein